MLIIPIKDGENIDKALKRFKRKFDKTGVMRSLRDRKQFVKQSVVQRTKIKKAQYIQKPYTKPSQGTTNLYKSFFLLIYTRIAKPFVLPLQMFAPLKEDLNVDFCLNPR